MGCEAMNYPMVQKNERDEDTDSENSFLTPGFGEFEMIPIMIHSNLDPSAFLILILSDCFFNIKLFILRYFRITCSCKKKYRDPVYPLPNTSQ